MHTLSVQLTSLPTQSAYAFCTINKFARSKCIRFLYNK